VQKAWCKKQVQKRTNNTILRYYDILGQIPTYSWKNSLEFFQVNSVSLEIVLGINLGKIPSNFLFQGITFTINQFISLSVTHITQFTNYTHHSPKATVYILWPRTRKLHVCDVTSLSDKAARKN
jgi:hypothetical protein